MGRLRGDSDASTRPIVHRVSIDKLERIKRIRSDRTREGDDGPVIGSTKLYDEAGEIILIPTPTPDPKGLFTLIIFDDIANSVLDPLNLPQWRKIVMIVSLAFCMWNQLISIPSTNTKQSALYHWQQRQSSGP